jgi:hypothetical protein
MLGLFALIVLAMCDGLAINCGQTLLHKVQEIN